MDDSEIRDRITALTDELKALRELEVGAVPGGSARLEELQVAIDQHWDLLRQRQAHEEFGTNPDAAGIRPAGEVEGYLQ